MKRRTSRLALAAAAAAALLVAGTTLASTPTASDGEYWTDHGVAVTVTLSGTAGDSGTADFTVTGGPSHGNLDATSGAMSCDSATPANCTADVQYTPDASYEGDDTFTFDVGTLADGTSGDATITIHVGSAPVANDDPGVGCTTNTENGSYVTYEDTPLTVTAGAGCGLLDNDTDADAGDTLSASLNADGSIGTASVSADGGFTYTPAANANGDDTFTYDASDGALSATATAHVHVIPVNDAPSFVPGADQTVDEDSGPQTVPGWATQISPGPNEAGQQVDFILAGDSNPGLFAVEPAVSPTGELTYTPAANANGAATIQFEIHDDGSTANGGVDTSAPQSMTITVNPVNDPPTFDNAGDPPAVDEDSGPYSQSGWATNISPGPADEQGQTVSFSVTADTNPGLFLAAPAVSDSGTLTFTPGANRNGTADVTVVAVDSGGGATDTSAPVTFTVTVNPVNDPPNAVNDSGITVPEESPGQVIDVLANDTSLPDAPETLTITAVTQGVHGLVVIAADGSSVTYVPDPLYYGDDFFTYTIQDPGGLSDTAWVFLTVAKDTTPPIVSGIAQRIRTSVTMTSTTLPGRVTWTGFDAGVGIDHYTIQRSLNGGSWSTLANPTAASYNVSYTFGTTKYRYRVRAVDRNGNVGAWTYTPTFGDARYQETSSYITYSGTWTRVYNASDSGYYAKYTSVAGRSATFRRSMRDVAFVAPTSSTRGSVKIYVDGVYKATVSLRSSTTQYRRVLWTWHFGSLATHSIKLVVVGNGRVDLDCFVVLL